METGLTIRVATSGAKTYVVRYKFLNKIRRLTLGRLEDIVLGGARDLTREVLRKVQVLELIRTIKMQVSHIYANRVFANERAFLIGACNF